MKQANNLIVTPGRLLTSVKFSLRPKSFKSIYECIRVPKMRKRVFKKSLPALENEYPEIKALPLDYFESMSTPPPIDQRYLRLNHSSMSSNKYQSLEKVKKLENSESPIKKSLEIPQLNYRDFERFHLLRGKDKNKIKSHTPNLLSMKIQEKLENYSINNRKVLSTQIKVSEYSKEYSTKMIKVNEIMRMVEAECAY